MTSKIKDSVKQYGLIVFGFRVLRKFFSILGINFECYYYLNLNLESYCISDNNLCNSISRRFIYYSDFLTSYNGENYLNISSHKMEIIKNRFSYGGYEAFGAFDRNNLIYTSWISKKKLDIPGACAEHILNKNEVLLLDDYCASYMRSRGIHSSINCVRLKRIKELGFEKAVVVIMCGNVPALKSHLTNGFHVRFRYYTLSIFGNKYSNLNEKLKNN